MSPNQQFAIAVLTIVTPLAMLVIPLIFGVIMFDRQNKKLAAVEKAANNAAEKSDKAEKAANHGKEVVSAMQANFKAVVDALAPAGSAGVPATLPAPSNISGPTEVVIVNPTDLPVPVTSVKPANEEGV